MNNKYTDKTWQYQWFSLSSSQNADSQVKIYVDDNTNSHIKQSSVIPNNILQCNAKQTFIMYRWDHFSLTS